jgi:hypothetical protein
MRFVKSLRRAFKLGKSLSLRRLIRVLFKRLVVAVVVLFKRLVVAVVVLVKISLVVAVVVVKTLVVVLVKFSCNDPSKFNNAALASLDIANLIILS